MNNHHNNNQRRRSQGNSRSSQHQQFSGSSQQSSSQQREQRNRRDWLWRRRLELELEVHHLLAQEQEMIADLQTIQQRKELLQRQRPQIVAQILITGLVKMPAPSERTYHYAMERLFQEETSVLQQWNWCRSQYTRLQGQITTINIEIALLDASL